MTEHETESALPRVLRNVNQRRVLACAGLLTALSLAGCSHSSRSAESPRQEARGVVPEGTPDPVNIALARAGGSEQSFVWREWSPAVFAEAKRDGKWILVDGAAEWCHWCHVMDETTYRDPVIGKVLRDKFIAIRVDVDQRPDIEERYSKWGWPATILLSPNAEELGKYRGYLKADELRGILSEIENVRATDVPSAGDAGDVAGTVAGLPWIAARVLRDMDQYWDPDEGGWGRKQKAALGANTQFELVRASHGDRDGLAKALLTLAKERAITDPVWGGVYQYSAGATWNEPHFEKLMSVQTEAIEAYSRAFAATREPALAASATAIARYVGTFLTNAAGAFLVSQDADVNAHDANAPFIDGHVFYAKDDAGRRALGMPRVDDHVAPLENGLAIAAFATLYETTGDLDALARAKRAADEVVKLRVDEGGAVRREGKGDAGYLVDAAALGFGLVRLAAVTRDVRYRDLALSIATRMGKDMADDGSGALFERTIDPAAAGVFARRRRPFEGNVMAARLYAELARLTGDESLRERGQRVLAGVATPRALDEEGRMLGGFLLAANELGAFPWPKSATR